MAKFIPVEPEKWAEMVKAQAEVERLKAEVERLRKFNEEAMAHISKEERKSRERLEMEQAESTHLKAEVERLRSQFANSEWQPIDTAPEGEDVWFLAYFVTEHGEKMVDVVCKWSHGEFTTGWDLKVNPTHWMHLPNPPVAKEGKPTA